MRKWKVPVVVTAAAAVVVLISATVGAVTTNQTIQVGDTMNIVCNGTRIEQQRQSNTATRVWCTGAAPTTTTTTTAPTTTVPTCGPKATLANPNVNPLASPVAASRVCRNGFEPRRQNEENQRVPTSSELQAFYSNYDSAWWGTCSWMESWVNGQFTGTTDEIIQWAAHKWSLDEDRLRAQAQLESNWDMDTVGDGGISYGLMQIKSTAHRGTAPLSQLSTAFNIDFAAALMRSYYDGCHTWLNDFNPPRPYPGPSGTASTNLTRWKGTEGVYYSGRWYDSGANWYIGEVDARFTSRVWAQPGF